MKKNTAIIVAGGKGERMKVAVKKQYLVLKGIPVLARTIEIFSQCNAIDAIIVVVPPPDIAFCQNEILSFISFSKPVTVTGGGRERQDSVYNGLLAIKNPAPDDIVIIHDGVRPFITPPEIEKCITAAERYGASIMAVPVSDTLKYSDGKGFIEKTLDRQRVFSAQTPQVFKHSLIYKAHTDALNKKIKATDDASLIELSGKAIHITTGKRTNIKLTTPEDIAIGNALLEIL
jgi:2-C-methyl-D-erythritol 4-phosphate cytidylyltransferase